MLDVRDVRVLGKVDDETKRCELEAADVLCAPSLGGESFGMVLTEAFAAGTPVIASDIAGYRDVVRDGVDGVLVPRGDAQALAEALRDLYEEPDRRARDGSGRRARRRAVRVAARRRAGDGGLRGRDRDAGAGDDRPARRGPRRRTRGRPEAARPAATAASLEPPLTGGAAPQQGARHRAPRRPRHRVDRRRRCSRSSRSRRSASTNIASALITSSPTLVLLGLAIMCSAMVLRAVLVARDPAEPRCRRSRVRMSDAVQGTFIGVLMSSTLPARLGEPSRALVVARRTGRPRENLPIVLGTVVSQTLLNIVALIVLGAVMFSSVDFFNGHQNALLVAAIAPRGAAARRAARAGGPARRPARIALARGSHALARRSGGAMARVRAGLIVFRHPRLGATATVAQLAAWALQCLSCCVLLVALGLERAGAGIGAAAAVLFAVNITAVLPATPANLGVFQAACAAVLHTGWHIGVRRRRRLRRDPPGGRGHDRDPHGHAGAAQGGHVLARGQAARDALDAGQAARRGRARAPRAAVGQRAGPRAEPSAARG